MKEPNTPILLTENLEEEIINDNILHNHKINNFISTITLQALDNFCYA